ncbi:hypothetical protein [Flavobacterium sp.]|jgi:hypothetical protein|uniref:hypothetical protein n=1 Tax=Flavobacterium sp. TaxID=239 RepID=UPI0037BEBCFA
MTQNQYEQLAIDLQFLTKIVPLNWGSIQNNKSDNKINMFAIHSFDELEQQVANLSDTDKNYLRRRWFLWKCAKCDEHIFAMNNNVNQNLNSKDQTYDIEFNNNPKLRFDVKGTVIPRCFRATIEEVMQNPTNMIKFFYDEQSKGVRNNYQNRLFIVHHSHKAQEREMFLRCQWEYKKRVYKEYSAKIAANSNFIEYQNTKSDVVFIIENLDSTITHNFFAVK